MQRAIDTTGALCGNVVKQHSGVALRELIVFGSRAGDAASPESDVDILVVIEPANDAWGPAQNMMERKRLHAAAQPRCTAPLDLWVRTIDQFEEAHRVIGCVEYLAATRGCALYSCRPSRMPQASRSADEIRRRNVCNLLDDSRRVLGRAVRIELGTEGRSAPHRDAQYYAWRAIQHAVCAIFANRQVETPEKSDDLPTMLAKLGEADLEAGKQIKSLRHAVALTPAIARNVMREIVGYLGRDPQTRSDLAALSRWLHKPLYLLADAPALKA